MILEKGDMFSQWNKTGLFLFTSNPIVNSKGLAVMGRGIAKQLADKCPTIRKDFAWLIHTYDRSQTRLWCAAVNEYDRQLVGCFMVKSHWAEKARLDYIRESVDDLLNWIEDEGLERVDLNFPGIGNGRLKREDVLPIISKLPNNVHVWEFA